MTRATRCPFAQWKPITTNFAKGGRRRIRGFVPHVQVGNGSLWGFFNTPKPPGQRASSDFWCSKKGVLEQYVDLADQAFAQGSREHNGNPEFVSCEFEGYPGEPMTAEQILTGGELIAWLRSEVSEFRLVLNHDPENGEGITPHYVFGGGHTCPLPGPRESQFPDLIRAAQPQPSQPASQEDDDMTRFTYLQRTGTTPVLAHFDDGRNVHIDYNQGLGFQTFEDLYVVTLGCEFRPDPFPKGYHETTPIDDGSGQQRIVTIVGAGTADALGLP